MKNAYLVDLGTLIFPGEHEFDSYAVAYDSKYGYYDENQYYTLDRDVAIRDAEQHLEDANERAYAIVTETWLDDGITQGDIDAGVPVEDEHYLVEDVIFGKAVIEGEVVELFQ